MKLTTRMTVFTGVVALGLLAGNGNGNAIGGGNGSRARVDLSKQIRVEGAVSSVSIAAGVEYPSITVDKKQIKVAPAWYLGEKDFELKEGQNVSVLAAPSNDPKDPYLHALVIDNRTTQKIITLRNDDGMPLWIRRGSELGRNDARPGYGMSQGGCIDLATVKTAAGLMEKITLGFGLEHPSLTVKLDDGSLLAFKIGPERIVLESDWELKPGMKISVMYAEAPCCEEHVALELTVDGKTLVLRDELGRPSW